MAQVDLHGIRKSFGAVEVIRGVDLQIREGEFVVFVGPSGCGKSTMLRMISGLEDVTEGRIEIAGRDVTHVAPSKRDLAMVFQSYALFPHLSVADNIGFGLRLSKAPKAEIERRVGEVARTLKLEALLDRMPRQLSGGQRQRVAIGRSIIRNPRVFLFDEPLSNLDAALRVHMRLEIARLHRELDGVTMIYVTHDQVEAMTLADRIVVFNGGRIEQVGTPMELYDNPANTFVAGFIGAPSMNFFAGVTQADGAISFGNSAVRTDHRYGAGQEVQIGVRPEHLTITEPGTADFNGELELIEELGADRLLYVRTAFKDEPMVIRADSGVACREGQPVGVRIEAARMHVFSA